MDEKSLTVTYKDWRGEPRGSVKKAEAQPGSFGDCIDCNQCVAVCPTGIDIREGPQIGCITCALCIDACDKVMDQVGRPRGLIDYVTEEDAELEKAGQPHTPVLKTLFRPRTILYFSVWGAIGLAMLFAVGNRTRIDISANHDRNPLYVQLADGAVRNAYTANLRNMENRPRTMEVSMSGLGQAVLWSSEGSRETAGQTVTVDVPADSVGRMRLFVAAPGVGASREEFVLTVRAVDDRTAQDSHNVFFERPESAE
ncbi:MAG: hypothetical protein Pars93KO_20800 [Parasphingorhabdus sp.]